MVIPVDVIGQIYEAGGSPELWPSILETVANLIGAFGACVVHRSGNDVRTVINPAMEDFAVAYFEAGFAVGDERMGPVIAEHYPGFRVDSDYWTEEQQRQMPVYRDFLLPRNMNASAGSIMQGTKDDVLWFAIEGLPSYATAHQVVPHLNMLRPHLARALSLSMKMKDVHERGVVAGLEAGGIAAAVVGPDSRLRAANEGFGEWFGGDVSDVRGNVQFRDASATRQLRATLALRLADRVAGHSFPIREGSKVAVLHCLPLKGRSRDIFESDGHVLLLAHPDNRAVPSADLLRLLFDLTPAEARLARLIGEGKTVEEAAYVTGVKPNTVRTHLKSVFMKTGYSRQGDLAAALSSFGMVQDR